MTRTSLLPVLLPVLLCACGAQDLPPEPLPSPTETPVAEPTTSTETAPEGDPEPLKAVEGAYGAAWNVDYGWPGEYPNGFTIEADNVVLPARTAPVASQPHDLACPLDKGVTIHPWNAPRAQEDNLIFIVANQVLPLEIVSDVDLYATARSAPDDPMTLSIKTGDPVIVTRYWGEGFGEIALNGEKYSVDLQEIFAHAVASEDELEEHQWVQLTCDDPSSTRAWILFDEANAYFGVTAPAIDEYGKASDIAD